MHLAVAFLASALAALVLTPPIRRLAWAVGYLDHPEARKLHTRATALLGGAAVVAAAVVGSGVAHVLRPLPLPGRELALWALGGAIAFALGLVDDRYGMRPDLKLLGQSVAAATFLSAGAVPALGLGAWADAILCLVFMVALMNAVNFLDNMDGVVGGLAAIALASFAVLSFQGGHQILAGCQLALAGGCVGFLRYNLRRASIFLGDAGSLLLGYSLGASALLAMRAGPGGWANMGVLLVVAYPLFDLCFVLVTRIRAGRPFYQGGRDHTNHRLASVPRCQRKTIPILYASGAALAASGMWVHWLNRPLPAALTSVLWATLLLLAGAWLSRVPVSRKT